MTGKRVHVDSRSGVLHLTFDNPLAKNALDYEAFVAVGDALGSIRSDPSVRVAIMGGAGGSFCSGVDLRWALTMDSAGVTPRALMDAANFAVHAILTCPVPVIARVDGVAAGGGASLAFAADLCYATEESYFLLAFTTVGLMPDCAATSTVTAAVGRARAAQLALLGQPLTAPEAARVGLIAEAVKPEDLDSRIDLAVSRFLRGSPRAFELSKAAINAAALADLEVALERERAGQVELLSTPHFSAAAEAALNRRKA